MAILHDTMEDGGVTVADLKAIGIPEKCREAVCLLTKKEGQDYMDYIQKIAAHDLARKVKLADMKHNSDLTRLPECTPDDLLRVEKYKMAIDFLQAVIRTAQ